MIDHCATNDACSSVIVKLIALTIAKEELSNFQPLEGSMFSTAYPSHAERQVYAQRAQRLRAAAFAGLVREIARLFSAAAR
jgi:hypothetical protein